MVLINIPAAHPERVAVATHSDRCIPHRSGGHQEEELAEAGVR